jgi:hypothetical protein
MGSLLKFGTVTTKKKGRANLVAQRKKVIARHPAKIIKNRLHTRFLGALMV